MKKTLVEVEWLDARTYYDDMPVSAIVEKCRLSRRLTSGYLIHKDRERLIVAHTFDPAEGDDKEDGGADLTVIPRTWVAKITEYIPVVTFEEKEKEEPPSA